MMLPFTRSRTSLLLALAMAAPGAILAQTGTPSAQALAYFMAQGQKQGLHDADVATPSVTSSYFDQSSGLTHTYLRQRVNGLDIYGAVGDVHTDRSGKPVLMHQGFMQDVAQLAPSATPGLTAAQAVTAAATGLQLPRPVGLTLVREARLADGLLFNNGGISEYDIPVRLMYFPINGKLKLVWDVTIAQLDQQHHWNVQVDAHSGQLLHRFDYTVSEEVTFQQINARAMGLRGANTAAAAAQTAARGTTGAPSSVTVFPVPLEAPTFGNRSTVLFSSINTAYSPYGWQVSDPRTPTGTYPASYSRIGSTPAVYLTRGNNVAAYDDSPNTVSGNGNVLSNTNSPNGGATLDFDFPFDQAAGPKASAAAAMTNLFYWNNMLHDVMMSKGFDEASGNFQYRNIGTQGAGGDYVRAEAQDGAGRNNANFSTPPDGQPGRMQMYLFDNPTRPTLTISAPASLAGVYTVGLADFGRKVASIPAGICGNLVAVNDGVSGNGGLHGCVAPYINAAAISGNIAVIMRGGCAQLANGVRTNSSFAGKVRRAQQNGAIMAIIIDSLATGTTANGMTGVDTVGIRIPSIFLAGVDGARVRAALQATTPVTVTGCAIAGQDYDGSMDNGVVSHEFGHGISNRLTGGPANASCVTSGVGTTPYQNMGEGWSDFFGLWMTTRTGDVGRTPRGVGTYALGQTPTGTGFRFKPYTDDMALNNYTFAVIGTTVGTANYTETHNVGEVWATTLWDLNWQFIYRYGFNPDFLGQTGGNNRFLRLVLDGCKLQVCNPGFLDGRDGILRADSLLNGAANSNLIWTMFARRGMGYSASQGPRNVVAGYPNGLPGFTGIVQAFDMPPGKTPSPILNPATTPLGTQSANAINGSLVQAYPNPAQNVLTIQSQVASQSAVQVSLINIVGKVVTNTTATAAEVQRGLAINTSALAEGLYIVRVVTSEGTYATKVQVKH